MADTESLGEARVRWLEAFGGVTLLAGFAGDITSMVPHGATVEVDPVRRTLRIVSA